MRNVVAVAGLGFSEASARHFVLLAPTRKTTKREFSIIV